MIDTGFYVPEAKLDRLADPAPRGEPVVGCDEAASSVLGWWRAGVDRRRLSALLPMMLNGGELDGARILTPETVD